MRASMRLAVAIAFGAAAIGCGTANNPFNPGETTGGTGATGSSPTTTTTGSSGSAGTSGASGSSGSSGTTSTLQATGTVNGVFNFTPAVVAMGTRSNGITVRIASTVSTQTCGLTGSPSESPDASFTLAFLTAAGQSVVNNYEVGSASPGNGTFTVNYVDGSDSVTAAATAGTATISAYSPTLGAIGNFSVTLQLADGGTGNESGTFQAPVCN